MRSFVRRAPLAAVVAGLLFAAGFSVKAEEPALADPLASPVVEPAAPQPRALYHTVHLRIDGNLTGMVNSIDAEGQYVPAVVTLNFVQNGLVIAETRTGEGGNFQVLDFVPGVYSVIVSGSDGLAVLRVHVAAYEPDVAEDQNRLDITLIPAMDIELLISGTGSGSAGLVGGGGGIGGGLGSLAGLAGSRRPDFVASPWYIAPPSIDDLRWLDLCRGAPQPASLWWGAR